MSWDGYLPSGVTHRMIEELYRGNYCKECWAQKNTKGKCEACEEGWEPIYEHK